MGLSTALKPCKLQKFFRSLQNFVDFPAFGGYTEHSAGENNGVPPRQGEERPFHLTQENLQEKKGEPLWAI